MNPLNYASLEASKRLAEAGIVLETEALWVKWYFDSSTNMNYHPYEWRLMYRGLTQDDLKSIPAPSMSEVWRELPETALQPCRDTTTGYCHEYLSLQKDGDLTVAGYGEYSEIGRNSNPTDALIDLLIRVRKENNAS